MPRVYCLINHELTHTQLAQLKKLFGVSKIVYPPERIKKLWADIPPEPDYNKDILRLITTWLEESAAGDLFFIQGDFGFTFTLVDYAIRKKLIPVYAATKRIETEQYDGEKVTRQYIFEHVCFRKYRHYSD